MVRVSFTEEDLVGSIFFKDYTDPTQLLIYEYELRKWLDNNCKEHYSLEYDSGKLSGIYFKDMTDLTFFRMSW